MALQKYCLCDIVFIIIPQVLNIVRNVYFILHYFSRLGYNALPS